MNLNRLKSWSAALLLTIGFAALSMTGCQASVGGQTLPSAYYLNDDVQFFPAGPEEVLTNQIQALEEYKLQQQANQEGIAFP